VKRKKKITERKADSQYVEREREREREKVVRKKKIRLFY
jgi:hypothetical protein